MKKILQIKKGEYLLEVMNGSIKTTYNKDIALDISNWSLEQLGYIVSNLKKVGYTKAKVLTISESLEDSLGELDNKMANLESDVNIYVKGIEEAKKSMEEIAESLKSVSKRLEDKLGE